MVHSVRVCCLEIPSVILTCWRRQSSHLLAGLGWILVPHIQHKLKTRTKLLNRCKNTWIHTCFLQQDLGSECTYWNTRKNILIKVIKKLLELIHLNTLSIMSLGIKSDDFSITILPRKKPVFYENFQLPIESEFAGIALPPSFFYFFCNSPPT